MPPNNYTPRIAILSGIVVPGDALSETVIADLEAVDRLAASMRRNLDVRVYCADSAHADSRISVVDDWRDVIRDPHFRSADIYLYHFGVYSSIHHTMAFARRDARVGVYFHNITPPQYLPSSAGELTERSFQQIEAFRSADLLMAASRYSVDQLTRYGLGKPLRVVPLFGRNASAQPAPRQPWCAPRPIKLLYCGRFVSSKGVDILLAAMARMGSRRGETQVELLMTGLMDYSDADYLARLRGMTQMLPKGMSARFEFDLEAEELRQRIAMADALVLPSLHEGFGMPVVEALAAGVPVVCSGAGALLELANGLALTFDAGNAESLALCLDQVVDACRQFNVASDKGQRPYPEWLLEAQAHGARFSRESYVNGSSERFRSLLQSLDHESNSFRAYLQDVGELAFGQRERVNTLDAALAALMATAEIKDTLKGDLDGTLVRLLRWPFAHGQSETDLAHWRGVLSLTGQRGLMRRISGSTEIRQSARRRQSGVYMQASLREPLETFQQTEQSGADELTIEHPTVQLMLAGDTPDVDFVRQAYLLLLGREPEHGGLGGYFESMLGGQMSRREVIANIMASEEFHLKRSQR